MKYNTGIKADSKFTNILSSVLGQMSDGIWEGTRSMEKYWKSLKFNVNTANEIELEDVYFVCADPRDFFANKIKQIIKIEIDNGNAELEWRRDCSGIPKYIHGSTVTVGDCYHLFDLLKGRDTANKYYSTYHTYDVTLTFDGMSFDIKVEALNEYAAKRKAIEKLTSGIKAKVTLL